MKQWDPHSSIDYTVCIWLTNIYICWHQISNNVNTTSHARLVGFLYCTATRSYFIYTNSYLDGDVMSHIAPSLVQHRITFRSREREIKSPQKKKKKKLNRKKSKFENEENIFLFLLISRWLATILRSSRHSLCHGNAMEKYLFFFLNN